MTGPLDQVARALAGPVSRRQSLRLLGMAVAAAVLGSAPRAAAAGTCAPGLQACPACPGRFPGCCPQDYQCCGFLKCCPPYMDCRDPCGAAEDCVCKPEFVCGGQCCAPPLSACVVGIC